jgi:hypothetical protein
MREFFEEHSVVDIVYGALMVVLLPVLAMGIIYGVIHLFG